MKWQVKYYKTVDGKEPVKDWLESFDSRTITKIENYFEKLHRKRLNLKHSFITHLETQLYEISIPDEKRVFKIIFFPKANRQLILLHAFTKRVSVKKVKQRLIA